jgi:hypothetical protein
MNTLEYIKAKQKEWAKLKGLELQGSKGERGDKMYTLLLEDNLFMKISNATASAFSKGDGNELGDEKNIGKMQALHSSSALGVNVFEYWKQNGRLAIIAKALHIPSTKIDGIEFEGKFKALESAKIDPNVDLVFSYKDGSKIGIECKYTEPFQSRKVDIGLKAKYLEEYKYWNELRSLKKLASKISPEDTTNTYFHCAQMIKHVLGMYAATQDKAKIRFVYLYQPAFFENNSKYEDEISIFRDAIESDQINFSSISWLELIENLANLAEVSDMKYIQYLRQRYF